MNYGLKRGLIDLVTDQCNQNPNNIACRFVDFISVFLSPLLIIFIIVLSWFAFSFVFKSKGDFKEKAPYLGMGLMMIGSLIYMFYKLDIFLWIGIIGIVLIVVYGKNIKT